MDAEEEAQRDHEIRLLCSVESSAVSLEGANNVSRCVDDVRAPNPWQEDTQCSRTAQFNAHV